MNSYVLSDREKYLEFELNTKSTKRHLLIQYYDSCLCNLPDWQIYERTKMEPGECRLEVYDIEAKSI